MAKYILPDFKLDAFTCPHCGTLSQMIYNRFFYSGSQFYKVVEKNTGISGCDSNVLVAVCQSCKNKVIWINNEYVYPDIMGVEPNSDMPDAVKKLYLEASKIYNKSPRAACALLRLAVDKLCHELGATDRDINKNIGILVKQGLPETVQRALDVVRVVGNKAVHPGQISYDVDDKNTAIILMKLLNVITERMITEPKEISELYEGLPDSAKNSIEHRDRV